MFTNQTGNTNQGDVVGGDQHNTYYLGNRSPLASLYAKLREANAGQPYAAQIAEQLQHFCSKDTDGDVRGLEDKLKAASREDLLYTATRLKEAATKLVMKWQTSGVAQDILTHILGKLYSEFLLHVTPAIESGASRPEVDALISERVLGPTSVMLGDNDLMLTPVDLLGLLFMLGGNCHVRWDKC